MNIPKRNNLIAGIDEAGRGSVVGPLVVAGVGIMESKLSRLSAFGLKDSKCLTRATRRLLFSKIIGIADYIGVCMISTREIDESVQINGLNKLEAEAMAAVINDMQPDNVYVDCCDVKPLRYASILETLIVCGRGYKLYSFHHADSLVGVVSAASIIAKVIRDNQIFEIKKSFNDIGSGYPSDKSTISFIRNWILKFGEAPAFVRKSWKPVKLILMESSRAQDNRLDPYYA
ncbi:MAG TPA: ribonuclease HII [Nitrososphaeraceae archaeon]|jgi:ribonuclease HII